MNNQELINKYQKELPRLIIKIIKMNQTEQLHKAIDKLEENFEKWKKEQLEELSQKEKDIQEQFIKKVKEITNEQEMDKLGKWYEKEIDEIYKEMRKISG